MEEFLKSVYIQSLEPIHGVPVDVLRLDAIDALCSGNKLFKLYEYVKTAKLLKKGLASTGGNCSNHLHALSAIGHRYHIPTLAYVQSYQRQLTSTLKDLEQWNTQLNWIQPNEAKALEFEVNSKEWILVPWGGKGELGQKGMHWLKPFLNNYSHVFCAAGTGTTVMGLSSVLKPGQQLLSISALPKKASAFKTCFETCPQLLEWTLGDALPEQVPFIWTHSFAGKYFSELEVERVRYTLLNSKLNQLEWDFIYTSRVLWAIKMLSERGYIKPKYRVLLIHTGGLQGNRCFQDRYQKQLAHLLI